MDIFTARVAMFGVITAALLSGCTSEQGAPEPEDGPLQASTSRPPPPISGGTLLVTADEKMAVAADPDRDRILLVDLAAKSLVGEIKLDPSDDPGRVVEGSPGRAHVVLRRGGAIATIDIVKRQIAWRAPVCPAPRGIAYTEQLIHVACAGGELVTLNAETGEEARRLRLEPDLRDVIVQGDGLLVSQFRSARVFSLDAQGTLVAQRSLTPDPFLGFDPEVAWRMVPLVGGGAAIVHQRASTSIVNTNPGGYGEETGCDQGIVKSTVTFLDAEPGAEIRAGAALGQAALPVDIAVSADGLTMAVVAAGSDTVLEMPVHSYRLTEDNFGDCSGIKMTPLAEGQPIAVAFAGGTRVVQTREPPRLVLDDGVVIELPGESADDIGHTLFHKAPNPAVSMACASCHPDGRDDGRVWNFLDVGARRTQSVAGGVLATAPLHWDGALAGFDPLMNEVFTGRMGGPKQSPGRLLAGALWLDSIPLVPSSPPVDAAAAERGKKLFESPYVGCATCHSGSRMTNNQSVDVGTGSMFQVPSLRGVALRAPYLHDGCAATLKNRFDPACGSDNSHGVTSGLSPSDIDDLVSYLETL